MNILSQKDPRWASVKLGQSTETIYKSGCTTTGISMLSDWYGCYKDPGYLAQHLSYTKSGLILWQSLEKVLGCCKFKWRFYTFDKKLIDTAIRSKNDTVLLNVDGGHHWVVALYPIPLTNKYWVANPWTSKKEMYSGVVGGALLTRK